MNLPLEYPEGFLELRLEEKVKICNGAGAQNGIKVPNTMYGMDMREVFDIHDYDYYMGATDKDKRLADRRMIVNLIIKIVNVRGFWMGFRLHRAVTYFIAVARYGGKAFRAGKGR